MRNNFNPELRRILREERNSVRGEFDDYSERNNAPTMLVAILGLAAIGAAAGAIVGGIADYTTGGEGDYMVKGGAVGAYILPFTYLMFTA